MADLSETWMRVYEQLIERTSGPLSFRFVLQPIMATLLALRDGAKDAREERTPYLYDLVSKRETRLARLHEGLLAVSRVLVLGLVVDVIYQLKVLHKVYAGEALIVALGLAFVPYLLFRGPFARLIRFMNRHRRAHQH
jgi:hypothetical protein